MEHKIKSKDIHDLHEGCCNEVVPETATVLTEGKQRSPAEFSMAKVRFIGFCIIIGSAMIAGALVFNARGKISAVLAVRASAKLEKTILPAKGVALPVQWGSIGKQLIDNGTIDQKKFEKLYADRGGLDEATRKLLAETNNGQLVITKDNASTVLNLLWALGLANKNVVLDQGQMKDPRYGGAGNFASTGGWTLASGNPMNHYSRHTMIPLTPEQQKLVESVSKNIYRPCCGNSTYFPDCNHGMAMLGLLELMASQGVSEGDMYKAALAVNSFWFPDTYVTIAQFLQSKGISWDKVGAKEILSANFSSAQGYQQIKSQMAPVAPKASGASCGV